jgi:hypothetical protein
MLPHRVRFLGHDNDWADRIEIGELLNFVNLELGIHHMFLSDAEIGLFLQELRDIARPGVYNLGNDTEEELVEHLRECIARDLRSDGGQGLYQSRSRFMVYCFVAQRIHSRELARALVRFFLKRGDDIANEERHTLLAEWCIGLQKIEGLAPGDKWHRAFHQATRRGPPLFEEWRRPAPHRPFMADMLGLYNDRDFNEYGRGRVHELLGPRVRRNQIQIVPGMRLGELPPYPRAGYIDPVVAPAYGLNDFQLEQRLRQIRMARLLRDVDDHRY